MTATYVPGTLETDKKKIIMSLQQMGPKIDALNAATYVNSIAGNSGAFTLNSTTGITNSVNDIQLQQATSSQFGAVKVDNTTITASGGVISTVNPLPLPIHASLGSDVSLTNTGTYFDGPSIAQGSTGTWFVSGTVTCTDPIGATRFDAKLWDGTTVIASAASTMSSAGFSMAIALSGYISSPAGNLRISVKDNTSTSGKISFNTTGNSKDSTISAYRIA